MGTATGEETNPPFTFLNSLGRFRFECRPRHAFIFVLFKVLIEAPHFR
jgi:hypothetical protein